MAKNKLRHIHFLLRVHHYRNAFTIVPHLDLVAVGVDSHFDHRHLLVSVEVVRCVYDYFI